MTGELMISRTTCTVQVCVDTLKGLCTMGAFLVGAVGICRATRTAFDGVIIPYMLVRLHVLFPDKKCIACLTTRKLLL